MILGYEGFYRIIGHSWLNVLMVGNVTVAGLEQSKFIPSASGLLGLESTSRSSFTTSGFVCERFLTCQRPWM